MHSPINISTSLIKIAVACTILGLLVASLMRGWIIIQLPTRFSSQQTTATAEQRICTLWLHSAQGWHKEEQSCVFPHDTAAALHNLMSCWVTLVNEEKISAKPLELTSALISNEHIAYVSFEQTPFSLEQSTKSRWLFVESLLRTIKDNLPQITSVMLLVHHKPLIDRCLDFSKPWPIQGFLGA
jgi:hypothetical protein